MKELINKHKTLIILTGVFLLAFFIRVYRLGVLPGNFHEDEVLGGYVGRFILQNGKDIYGNSWPLLYFNKFGDYYIILPIYLSGIATYFFGINEFATRFPSALFGALAVIPVFYLALMTFKNKKVAMLSALLSAIAPWNIVLARSTTEGIIGSTVFLTAVVVLLTSIKKQSLKLLGLSAVLIFIGYFIYHPFRIYPVFVLPACLLLFKQITKTKKYLLSFILMTVVFIGLTAYISTTFWGKGRFVQTSIFSPISGVSIKTQQLIFDEGQNNIMLARIFHNKIVGYGREFLNQYLTYFSPTLLFLQGWFKTRYIVPEQGLLYLTFMILFALAVVPLKTKPPLEIDRTNLIFLIFLILLAPFPAALTATDTPNVNRTVFLSYVIVILAGYGFYKSSFVKFKKLPLSLLICVFLAVEIIYFWHQYSRHTDLYSSLYRNDPQKQVAIYAREKEKTYDWVFLPAEGAMSWYYLFYNRDFSPNYIGRFRLDARIDSTNKVKYVESSCPSNALTPGDMKEKIIVIDRFNCVSSDKFTQIDTIQGINPLLAYKVLVPKK